MPDKSDTFQDVKPRSVRFDDATWASAEEAAKRYGIGSAAEYVRQATISRLSWDRALDLVREGADPDLLSDPALFARVLEELARRNA